MTMLLKSMRKALLGADPGQVLILMPFSVPIIVQFVTVTPLTSNSSGNLPRLPTLYNKQKFEFNF